MNWVRCLVGLTYPSIINPLMIELFFSTFILVEVFNPKYKMFSWKHPIQCSKHLFHQNIFKLPTNSSSIQSLNISSPFQDYPFIKHRHTSRGKGLSTLPYEAYVRIVLTVWVYILAYIRCVLRRRKQSGRSGYGLFCWTLLNYILCTPLIELSTKCLI